MCQLPKTKEELDEYIKQAQRLKWKEEKRAYRKRLTEKKFSVQKECDKECWKKMSVEGKCK